MIFEFDWNPRWVMIISLNSLDRSTFDISSEDGVTELPLPFTVAICTLPELLDSEYKLDPDFIRPAGLLKVAIATWAKERFSLLVKVPVNTPELSNDTLFKDPAA